MDRHNVKVSIQPWDSDKDPNGYWEWMRSISSLVRSCDGGNELQDFTDEKLGLPVVKSHVVPTCIANDPDFDSDDDGDTQRSSESKFRSPSIEATNGSAKAEDPESSLSKPIRAPTKKTSNTWLFFFFKIKSNT